MLNQRVPSYLGWLVASIRHLICKIGSRDWKVMNPMRNLPSYPSVSGFLEFPHTSLPNNQDLLYMIYQVCRFFWDFYTILHSSTLIQRSQRTVCAAAGRTKPRVAAAAGSWNVPQCRGAWRVHGPGETIWQRHGITSQSTVESQLSVRLSRLADLDFEWTSGLMSLFCTRDWFRCFASCRWYVVHHTYLVSICRSIQSPKSHFARFKNRYSCVCHGCHVDVALSLSLYLNSSRWGWDVCHLRPVSSCPVSSSVAKLCPAQLQDCSRTTRLQPRTAVWARANGSPRVADGAHGTSDGPTSPSAHEPATLQFRTAPCWWAEQGWKPLRRCRANPVPRSTCLDSWQWHLRLVRHVHRASSARWSNLQCSWWRV